MAKASGDSSQGFWLDKPQMMGLRGWSLLVPALASSVGFFAFGVLGFGFTEVGALTAGFREALVLTGAFALAFGSEVGTLSSITEIYRKGERLGRWDKFALAVSVLSTFSAFILAFASLLGVKATWGQTVQLYGPIVLGMLAALDSYGGFMEFGLYLNSYDKRIKQWQLAYNDFRKEQAVTRMDAQRKLDDRRLRVELARVDTEMSSELFSTAKLDNPVDTLAMARETRRRKAEDAEALLLTFYQNNPLGKQEDAAQAVGRSRAWVSDKLAKLEQDGRIKRNGHGVEMLVA